MAGSAALAQLDQVGWRAKMRPQSGLAHVLGAGAGVFAVVAVEDLVVKISSDDLTVAGILLNLALVVVAIGVALLPVGPARATAVVALVLATPAIWFYVFYGNHQAGTGWFRGIYLLSAAMYLVFYSMLWTRGRAIFLALALLFVASYIQFEIHRQAEATRPPEAVVLSPQTVAPTALPDGRVVVTASIGDFVGHTGNATAGATLGLGVIFLGVGCLLVRRRYLGAAVAFLVIGAIEGFAGAIVLGVNEGSRTLFGLLLATVGLILGLAGTGNTRRGSVWIGVIAIVLGLLTTVTGWTTDVLGRAGYYGLIGLALLAAGFLLMRPLQEAPDSGEPNR